MKIPYQFRRAICIVTNAGFRALLSAGTSYLWHRTHLAWQDIVWFFRVGRMKDAPVVTLGSGQRMRLHRDDRGISRELFVWRSHEPIQSQWLERLIKEGMVVVDIGSNIGYYVLIESRLVGLTGRVIAIEPVQENIRVLNDNLALNNIRNVSVVHAAITDRDGDVDIFMSQHSNWHSVLAGWGKSLGKVSVPGRTLDSLIGEMGVSVNLIRMDIEGAETLAVNGMVRTLEKFRPLLSIEVHPGIVGRQRTIEMLNRLKALGYDTEYVVDRERDSPWNKNRHGVRSMSIDLLIRDRYMVEAERQFTVLLRAIT